MFTQAALRACPFVLAGFIFSMHCSDWLYFPSAISNYAKFPQCIQGGKLAFNLILVYFRFVSTQGEGYSLYRQG